MADVIELSPDVTGVNEVRLVGRLSAAADHRTLPSGDVMAVFRLVVARQQTPDQRRGPDTPRRRAVDVIECVGWRGDVRRVVSAWQPGDVVEVHGALHRRFWRSPTGPASRYEVAVTKARRLQRGAS